MIRAGREGYEKWSENALSCRRRVAKSHERDRAEPKARLPLSVGLPQRSSERAFNHARRLRDPSSGLHRYSAHFSPIHTVFPLTIERDRNRGLSLDSRVAVAEFPTSCVHAFNLIARVALASVRDNRGETGTENWGCPNKRNTIIRNRVLERLSPFSQPLSGSIQRVDKNPSIASKRA